LGCHKTWQDLNMFVRVDTALEVPHFQTQVQNACNIDDFWLQAVEGGCWTQDTWGTAVVNWVKQGAYSLLSHFTGQERVR